MAHASKDRTDASASWTARAAAAILLYPLLAAGLGLTAGCAGGHEKTAEEACLEEGNRTVQAAGEEQGCPEMPD